MRDPNWVPPHVREQQFRKSVKRTVTVILSLAVGIPFALIAWTKESPVLALLIPIIILVIAFIVIRSSGTSNQQYVQDYLADLNQKTTKPPKW